MSEWSAEDARRFLLSHHRVGRVERARGHKGIRRVLERLRCIQLDPLDPFGTNADLVVLARVDGVRRGDVYRALSAPHAFEHFAKERCLLPADAFPQYRAQAVETPWWRLSERSRRVGRELLESVYGEVEARGPVTARELADRGAVRPMEWSGWKGTARMATMALEVLWTRCRIVTVGRDPGGAKRYDVPRRALPEHAARDALPFGRWALLERVQAAGLLARAGGPQWSMLRDVRTSGMVEELLAAGEIEEVIVAGSRRPYLKLAEAEVPRRVPDDGRLRILGPLDPLIWDRKLVAQAFSFDYVWEVYKPKEKRRYGWYVCPLLHRGQLVGRLEARVGDGVLRVSRLYREKGQRLDERALDAALERHAEACGASAVERPRL